MTKTQMIQEIQKQEATLFLEAKQFELEYGPGNSLYKSQIKKWLGVNELMEHLGIQSDGSLPESKQAAELISQIWRQKL